MKKLLCSLASALLALSICVPTGAAQALAQESDATSPTASTVQTEQTGEATPDVASSAATAAETSTSQVAAASQADAPEAATPAQDAASSQADESEAPTADVPASATDAATADAAEQEPASGITQTLEAAEGSGFHATISSSQTSYSAGSTAVVSVKYTIDQGSFSAGDSVTVSVPSSIASRVRFSVDPLHFSSVTDNGDGTWSLVLGKNAGVALSGSFSMYVTTANVKTQVTAPITVGDGSLDITVIPNGSADGTDATYTDAIMKDASDNGDLVSYYGYDYSEGVGDKAAQIGVYDSSQDQTLKFRLFINDKRTTMNGITVVDTLPAGMTFNGDKGITVTTSSGDTVDSSLYTVSTSGNTLTFTYPGELTGALCVSYWVDVAGGTNVKYTNRAEITYQSNGTTYQEHRNYVLQGNNYNAACGEKSVDKTVITADPDDQLVTYTIKFWNSDGFAPGEINLTDMLDSHVRFVYADPSDKFSVTYDEATNSVKITNTSAMDSTDAEYVRFVTDFTDVPAGYVVANSVGGNTTKTLKLPNVQLSATKTVDGQTPGEGQVYTFQLCDEQGTVLQEKQNDGGQVAFDPISYSADDLAADGSDTTVRYTVKELSGSSKGIAYDGTVYDVAVLLHQTTDDKGAKTLTATPTFTKNGVVVDAMTFDNQTVTTSVPVTKKWVGGTGSAVTVRLLADGSNTGKTLSLTADSGWTGSFTGLPAYDAAGNRIAYTVEEAEVPQGYTSQVVGDADSGFIITNTRKPDTPTTPQGDGTQTPHATTPEQPMPSATATSTAAKAVPGTGDRSLTAPMVALLAALMAGGVAALIARRHMNGR